MPGMKSQCLSIAAWLRGGWVGTHLSDQPLDSRLHGPVGLGVKAGALAPPAGLGLDAQATARILRQAVGEHR